MPSATFCPHFFVFERSSSLSDIERRFVEFNSCHSFYEGNGDYILEISSKLVDMVCQNFPWDRIADPAWRGYVLDWMKSIYPKLDRMRIDCPLYAGFSGHEDLWNIFLREWSECPGRRSSKGINAINDCNYSVDSASSAAGICSLTRNASVCSMFIIVKKIEDLNILANPWILKFDLRLPIVGENIFVPKTTTCVVRGARHGYVDSIGREWCWDYLHNDHWDVQVHDGYIKIAPDGRQL